MNRWKRVELVPAASRARINAFIEELNVLLKKHRIAFVYHDVEINDKRRRKRDTRCDAYLEGKRKLRAGFQYDLEESVEEEKG